MTKEQARPGMRIEEDALGNVEVPADHLWGAQTQRSHLNFPIGVERFHWRRAVIRALGILKKCAALANGELGQLPKDKVDLIVKAAQEVIDGTWDSEFPLVVFQTGSGTQTNMNANEVIANRAIQIAGGVVGSKKPVHPNDHVNHSQSSNDTFPTVMHIAAVEEMSNNLLPAVKELRETLAAKSKAYADVVMVGRTHLQDATPLTLGQAISGWVGQLDHAIAVLERAIEGMYALAIGGTAVGTGLNADPRFGDLVAKKIAAETGKPFLSAPNKFAALSAHDELVNASAAMRTLAGQLPAQRLQAGHAAQRARIRAASGGSSRLIQRALRVRHRAERQADQAAPRQLAYAGDCAQPAYRLRKSRADLAARLSRGSQPQGCGAQAWLSHGRRVRSVGAAGGDDPSLDKISRAAGWPRDLSALKRRARSCR